MALETLKGVEKIGGFDVQVFEGSENYLDSGRPIGVCHASSELTFRIQNGPIKENGVNGCQVDTLIHAAKVIIDGLDLKFPCMENKMASHGLQAALWALESRKANREARGVEGTSKA